MKNKWILINIIFSTMVSSTALATVTAPIQRIDIANMLSNSGGVTKTAVNLSFKNTEGGSPCFSATLAFQANASVFAGPGQACLSAIISVTVTPAAVPGGLGIVYLTPDDFVINNTLYYTQVTISENTAPLFDPSNGAILNPGTVKATIVENLNG